MARLAEYMADLALLLGEQKHVHFDHLDAGSLVLVQNIEHIAYPKVMRRVDEVRAGGGPSVARKAFNSIDRRLALDNATATLGDEAGGKILAFPGRDRIQPIVYNSFRQQGSLDGVLMRIGGKDRSVHAKLIDRTQEWNVEMTREMARRMRAYLFEQPLRVYGAGRWRRDPDEGWVLEQFTVTDFEVLDDAPWEETVARLRKVKGAGWKNLNDPLAEVEKLRKEDEDMR
ncbi:MAG: hypothetical protein ACOCYE_06300 [Pseudomonadota bacterium]